MIEGKNIPELRFPGFTGEWEEKKLGEILKFKNGLNADGSSYGKGIKFINVLDILDNNYITYDKIIGKVNVSDEQIENNQVKYGDVLFQRSSETREEIATSNIYLDNKRAIFGGFVIRGTKIENYDPIFMNFLLKSDHTRKQMERSAGGSTRYNIGQKELKNITYYSPSIPEQEKIGSFFYTLDQKLDLQKKRIEELKIYKKGMMQRIFSQEIRFKDKNGQDYPDWEEKKLGEVAEIKTGNTPPTKDIDNYGEEYLFVSPGDLGRKKYINATEKMLSNKGYSISRKFAKSSILFTCIGSTIGKLGIAGKDLTSNQQINAILPNNNYNSEYLYYSLDFLSSRIKLLAYNQAVPIINKSEFEKIKIYFPSLPEQEKIASFLSNLDRRLELEEERLEAYEEFKKGLMQRMFV